MYITEKSLFGYADDAFWKTRVKASKIVVSTPVLFWVVLGDWGGEIIPRLAASEVINSMSLVAPMKLKTEKDIRTRKCQAKTFYFKAGIAEITAAHGGPLDVEIFAMESALLQDGE